MKKSAKIRQKKNNVPCGTMKRRNEKMCKFTKVTKMLENYGVSNYFVQFGEMEIHTTKFYFYMVKVNNGILLKIRQNNMMTYFVDMVVKNQEQAKSIILGYVLESQKIDMEQLKEEMNTPKNDMEKLEFQKMEWFDTMQEEETIVPCGTLENEEEEKDLHELQAYAHIKSEKVYYLNPFMNDEENSIRLYSLENNELMLFDTITLYELENNFVPFGSLVVDFMEVSCDRYEILNPSENPQELTHAKYERYNGEIIYISIGSDLKETFKFYKMNEKKELVYSGIMNNVELRDDFYFIEFVSTQEEKDISFYCEEDEEYITFMNNEGEKTKALIVSRKNKNLLSRCNLDLIETNDGKYWELWTTFNGYLVAVDTDEYNQ